MEPVNAADLDWAETDTERMTFRRKQLGAAAGGDALGCSLYELAPGDAAWPYHYHAANEEALYVLAGTGLLRTSDGEYAIEAGDYAAFPTGEDGGHHVANDGDAVLRYLVVSTMEEPEVVRYPDGEGVGVMVGGAPGATSRDFEAWFKEDRTTHARTRTRRARTKGGNYFVGVTRPLSSRSPRRETAA